MMCNAKNGSVKIGDTSMDFVYGGSGEKKLIILPGLSDGLATVKGKALLLMHPYRKYFEQFTVYMFSRRRDIQKGYSIREMAEDQAKALNALNIESCCVLGVSQGGMIAQYLAIDHPEIVEKLVIAVSAPRVNENYTGMCFRLDRDGAKRRPQSADDRHGGEKLFAGVSAKIQKNVSVTRSHRQAEKLR